MSLPRHLILRVATCLSAVCLAAGCSSSDARARSALEAYQSAAASNDLFGARKALLQLVQAKDDVAQYWEELGKVEASMGAYSDAYYAFTRAYELDRSNPDILRAITEIALRSGNIDVAQRHAQELDVVAPGDPWVKLTEGWAAISQLHYDKALAAADAILATSPYDSSATGLKARALLASKGQDAALDLLNKQIAAVPSDAGSLGLLARIYEGRNDWPKVAEYSRRLNELVPENPGNTQLLIKAAFLSGDVAAGRRASFRLLKPNAPPLLVASVLDLWAGCWFSPQRIEDARKLAGATPSLEQRLIYAGFLSRVGSPADAIRLVASVATLPVNAKNAEANAVVAEALFRGGNIDAALPRFNAVLAFDPGNATALRGRSELELRKGDAAAAIVDAQKLVTVLPTSAPDRLLLARSYSAGDKPQWADRTLWSAFQEIPADERIFAALQATKKGDAEGTRELQVEFARQLDAKINRGMM